MAHSILSHKQYLVAQAEVELLTAKAGKKSAAEKKLADAQKDLEKPDGKHAPLREAEWLWFPMLIKNLNIQHSMKRKLRS